MNLGATGWRVVSAQTTQKGDVLILLDKVPTNENFTAEVKRVVEGLDEVKADSKKGTLEIRDLSPLATEKSLKVKLRKALRNDQTKLEVKVLNPNRRCLKLATVVLPKNEATKHEDLPTSRWG